MTNPSRGEIWLVDFHPARGSEQAGRRPALVVQNEVGNQYASTTIVAAISTAVKVYPVTVRIEPQESGLRRTSIVNCSQILTLDKSRLLRRLGKLEASKVGEVDSALKLSLGLS
jgi:mRNA interferase MazF